MTGAGLPAFIASLGSQWRGLSLTMPLKRDVLPLLTAADALVDQTGGANTVLLRDGVSGFNTDVYGITEAFRTNGVANLKRVQILGGGATAASALAAVGQLGASHVQVGLRDPAKGAALGELASALGVELVVGSLDEVAIDVDAVISTLPGHADYEITIPDAVRETAVLFDVAYDPWPSRLAAGWGPRVISGLDMLTLQALAQVRVFLNGSPDATLPGEPAVLAAMQRAVAS